MVREPADVRHLQQTVARGGSNAQVRSGKDPGTPAGGGQQKIVDRRDRQTGYVLGQDRRAHHKDPRRPLAQCGRVAEPGQHGENRQKTTVLPRHRLADGTVHQGPAENRAVGLRTPTVE